MASLRDQDIAGRFMHSIDRRIIELLARERPNPRYATVDLIDRDGGFCKVTLVTGGDSIKARMGSFQPAQVGQTVRVAGPPDELWIVDVIGNARLTGEVSTSLGVPVLTVSSLAQALNATWTADPLADLYEFEIADDAGFTTGVQTYQTISTAFSVQELTPGNTYYARVRSASSSGTVGAWSTTQSTSIAGFPAGSSDGSAPSSSPAAVVTGSIGFLLVDWVEVPNNDLVTYEIHVSLTSGFTPGPTTLLHETTGAFYTVRTLADSTPLPADTNVFVRLIAKDADGSAPAGAQGFDQLVKVDGDNTGITFTDLGDGLPPTTAPTAVTTEAGLDYIYLDWDLITNPDFVIYEVHISTTSGFLPTSNTLVGETPSNFFFIQHLGPGDGGASVTSNTVYYIRVYAKDVDGYTTAGATTEVSASTRRAGTSDLLDNAISNAKIQNLAVNTAKIADLAVTTAKIVDLNVTTAKIDDLAVNNAKIANLAVDAAKIANATITDAQIASLNADKIVAGTINAIDITASDITGGTLTGSNIRTASTGGRVQIDGASPEFIYFYSGDVSELDPGFVRTGVGNDLFGNAAGFMTIAGPKTTTLGEDAGPLLEGWSATATGTQSWQLRENLILNEGSQGEFNIHVGGTTPRLRLLAGINGTLMMEHDSSIYVNYINGIPRLTITGATTTSDATTSHVMTINSGTIYEGTLAQTNIRANGFDRLTVRGTSTSIYYSVGNREFLCQADGDVAIYDGAIQLWSAGTTISDKRFKKNIAPLDAARPEALPILREIPSSWFDFDEDKVDIPGRRLGVMAQDVKKVYPVGVKEGPKNMLLDTTAMLALSLAGVQELDHGLAALIERVERLEAAQT